MVPEKLWMDFSFPKRPITNETANLGQVEIFKKGKSPRTTKETKAQGYDSK
jgi:hypothetical protein